jgi:hypothetical protein
MAAPTEEEVVVVAAEAAQAAAEAAEQTRNFWQGVLLQYPWLMVVVPHC